MAFYDYSCRKCDFVFELMHGFNDKPEPVCPNCNSKDTFKTVSACGIIVRSNRAKAFVMDAVKKEAEQRSKLKELGLEKITPIRGVSLDQVYSEIKKQGGAVQERMHAQRERDDAKRKIKDREWKIKALKRTPERAKIRKEIKAKEDAAKRAIRL